MKVLIVFAHNEPQAFNAAMKNEAVATFIAQGHEVQVSDLYAMGFNPVASAADFGSRRRPDYLVYALEQRHNFEAGTLAPDIAGEVEKLQWADLVLFNFPIYWYGMPAILKGWIDRVFISGLCYGGRRIYDRGGLAGKRAMLAISLGGQEHMFGPDAIHGELDLLLRPIQRGMLGYVGMTVLPPFVAWHVPYVSDEERRSILEDFRRHIEELDSLKPLSLPSMSDFDDQLRPIGQNREKTGVASNEGTLNVPNVSATVHCRGDVVGCRNGPPDGAGPSAPIFPCEADQRSEAT